MLYTEPQIRLRVIKECRQKPCPVRKTREHVRKPGFNLGPWRNEGNMEGRTAEEERREEGYMTKKEGG